MSDERTIRIGMLFSHLFVLAVAGGCGNAQHFRGMRLDIEPRGAFLMVPPVAQSDEFLCGPAATASVLLYHGVPLDPILVAFEECGSKRAWSAADIVAIARAAGLEAYFYEGSLEDGLSNVRQGRPVLILLRGPPRTGRYPSWEWFRETTNMLRAKAHWVALVGWSSAQDVVLLDPLKGHIVMQRSDLLEEWKRREYVCVLMAPKPREPRTRDGAQLP